MALVAQHVVLTPNPVRNELKASWIWAESNTDHFLVRWGWNAASDPKYNRWLKDKEEIRPSRQEGNIYEDVVDIPSDAIKIWFHVLPVSKTYKPAGKDEEVSYWTAEWSTGVGWESSGSGGLPEVPGAPTVTLDGYTLVATLESFQRDQGSVNQFIEFRCVVRDGNNDTYHEFMRIKADAKWQYARAEFTGLEPGRTYKVQCRLIRDNNGVQQASDYGEFSSEVSCAPKPMIGFKTVTAVGSTSVRLTWDYAPTATSYDIQYASENQLGLLKTANDTYNSSSVYSIGQQVIHNGNLYSCVSTITTPEPWNASHWTLVSSNVDPILNQNKIPYSSLASYFDSGETTIINVTNTSSCSHTINNLESGHTYYFRIRAKNNSTSETNMPEWSNISSVTLGLLPKPPTTWSSTTTAIIGEEMLPTLFWIHNSRDNSHATASIIAWELNGVAQPNIQLTHTTPSEDDDVPTYQYTFTSAQAAAFREGGIITWRVKTKGLQIYDSSQDSKNYSDWSITRTIKLYTRPTVALALYSDGFQSSPIFTITQFPFFIRAVVTAGIQKPIGYYFNVVSQQDYTTVNNIGEEVYVLAGQTIYTGYIDAYTNVPEFDENKSYKQKDVVIHNGSFYASIYNSNPGPWSSGNWVEILSTNQLIWLKMMPNDIDLKNDIHYTLNCVATMDSGLTGTNSLDFHVDWSEDLEPPYAEIGMDYETVSTHIRPYHRRSDGSYNSNVYLSVYRREYDGSFVEIASDFQNILKMTNTYNASSTYSVGDSTIYEGIKYICTTAITTPEAFNTNHWRTDMPTRYNTYSSSSTYNMGDIVKYRQSSTDAYKKYICIDPIFTPEEWTSGRWQFDPTNNDVPNTMFVVDPHPSLDYARYRIVAIDSSTGAVSFNDVPGYPVKEHSLIIQWDEVWKEFDLNGPDSTLEDRPWTGSMLKLPYNIDISNNYDRDIELVNYIGRKRPVSYYGTQLGETATWSVDIPKSDKDTLYALRRLAIWPGNSYVREPSGSGYWAKVDVSFNINHKDVVIPITFNVTRVEGGV